MNILPLLILPIMVGCAAPTEQLIQEAKECVANHISPAGVFGDPTEENKQECWAPVNARMEAEARREKKRIENSCPSGSVRVVDSRLQRSGCILTSEVRDALGRQRIYGGY